MKSPDKEENYEITCVWAHIKRTWENGGAVDVASCVHAGERTRGTFQDDYTRMV
jgi:hypothetical protein